MAVAYQLFKARNQVTPFIIVQPDTVNNTSTSLSFIGQTLTNYGQVEQQDTLSLLENFANSSAPSVGILGQEWFNIADNQMYQCVNESLQTWNKINKPIVSATQPS